MRHKNDDNKDIRRIAWATVGMGIACAIIVLVLAVDNSGLNIKGINETMREVFIYVFSISVITAIFIGTAFLLFRFLDWNVLKTTIHLTAKKLSAYLHKKNSGNITPCLRSFLYELLKRNNDMLQLKLGQDLSCLFVNGDTVRKDCVFYRFSLITTKPPYEDKQLQQIIQGYINSELADFGILGLSPIYKSITAQCYSVYLDRCFYDESNSCLVFDVLYVCTEQSASYLKSAIERDTENTKPERTVYDDEL